VARRVQAADGRRPEQADGRRPEQSVRKRGDADRSGKHFDGARTSALPRRRHSDAASGDFNQKARELVEAATVALIAAKKHEADGITEANERIDVACDACHEAYQFVEDDPEGNKGKVLDTYRPAVPPKK